jgi:hypothetical protein
MKTEQLRSNEFNLDSMIEEKIGTLDTTTFEYIKSIVSILVYKDIEWLDKFYRKLRENKLEVW